MVGRSQGSLFNRLTFFFFLDLSKLFDGDDVNSKIYEGGSSSEVSENGSIISISERS
jgi:hypothetical protein